MVHTPFRDKDRFDCNDCGHELDRWNGSTWPAFTQVGKGTKPDA